MPPTPDDHAETAREGAFFGRRKGKTLRAGHKGLMDHSLPALRVDLARCNDPAALFAARPAAIHLEIGFGGGEHLARRASEEPETGFIGCEGFINGVAKLLSLIAAERLDNIRIHDDDARFLIDRLPTASIDRVYLLYPDPWPKRKHRKRRFLSEDMLTRLARIMKPGAELYFATDIDDYAAFALARIARSPDFVWTAERSADWLQPWAGWESTRYELKARREGRVSGYFRFRRVTGA